MIHRIAIGQAFKKYTINPERTSIKLRRRRIKHSHRSRRKHGDHRVLRNQVNFQEHRPQKRRSYNPRSRNALRDWLRYRKHQTFT